MNLSERTKNILLASVVAVVAVASLVYLSRCRKMEMYGGNQNKCEIECASSDYYAACMHVCMEGSSADFTGRADEYELDGIGAPIPLDENMQQNFISTKAGPFRYETPGH